MLDTARPGMPPVVTSFAAGGGRAMLVELSVMEQRYHAVMEVVSARRGLPGRPSRRRADGCDSSNAVPSRTRPHCRNGIDSGGYRIGSLFVVDPPAHEVWPGVGRVALDREVDLPHPGDRVEELF